MLQNASHHNVRKCGNIGIYCNLKKLTIALSKITDCTGFEHFRNIKDNVNKQLNKMYNNGLVVLDILMQKCYILYP